MVVQLIKKKAINATSKIKFLIIKMATGKSRRDSILVEKKIQQKVPSGTIYDEIKINFE